MLCLIILYKYHASASPHKQWAMYLFSLSLAKIYKSKLTLHKDITYGTHQHTLLDGADFTIYFFTINFVCFFCILLHRFLSKTGMGRGHGILGGLLMKTQAA